MVDKLADIISSIESRTDVKRVVLEIRAMYDPNQNYQVFRYKVFRKNSRLFYKIEIGVKDLNETTEEADLLDDPTTMKPQFVVDVETALNTFVDSTLNDYDAWRPHNYTLDLEIAEAILAYDNGTKEEEHKAMCYYDKTSKIVIKIFDSEKLIKSMM